MSFLPQLSNALGGLLKSPGDSLSAKVTKSGNQVIKYNGSSGKRSAVRYKSGTIVETIVHKPKK